ncbi:MAG: xanthine dehydrogenase family protein subunit M [Firmicutes bacterium]|nr:xanthine dehydrogenase family protein subunit M [Bacillota bacterium]
MLKNLTHYYRPESIDKALEFMEKFEGESAFIAGGTDIVISSNPAVRRLIDLRNLSLGYIREDKGKVYIGSAATLNEIAQSPVLRKFACGIISKAASSCVSNLIRNMATIGGNLASAVPSADMPPPLAALDAQVKVKNKGGEKLIPIEEFYSGYRKTVLNGGIITEVVLPAVSPETRASFIKLGRTASDIAVVNCAVSLVMKGKTCWKARIALGGVDSIPLRIKEAEKILEGQVLEDALISKAAMITSRSVKPISDMRASAGYRKEIAGVLVKRSLAEIIQSQ